jgi:hypothetical protein
MLEISTLNLVRLRDQENLVVLFNHVLKQEVLKKKGLTLGNSVEPQDILIQSKEEIDILIELFKSNLQKS